MRVALDQQAVHPSGVLGGVRFEIGIQLRMGARQQQGDGGSSSQRAVDRHRAPPGGARSQKPGLAAMLTVQWKFSQQVWVKEK